MGILFCLLRYWRIAQSVGCLLHKYENLGSHSQPPTWKLGRAACVYNPSSGSRETEGFLKLSGRQSRSVRELNVQWKILSQKQDGEQLRYLYGPLTFIQYAYRCTCTHTRIYLLKAHTPAYTTHTNNNKTELSKSTIWMKFGLEMTLPKTGKGSQFLTLFRTPKEKQSDVSSRCRALIIFKKII